MQDVGYERTLFVASGKQPLLRPGEPPIGAQNPQELRGAAIAACIAGQGVFQSLEIGLDAWFASGELVHILPDWSSERYPVYAYHPSRHLPPAKVRAFLDFVQEIAP